jgi:hypothetical protein
LAIVHGLPVTQLPFLSFDALDAPIWFDERRAMWAVRMPPMTRIGFLGASSKVPAKNTSEARPPAQRAPADRTCDRRAQIPVRRLSDALDIGEGLTLVNARPVSKLLPEVATPDAAVCGRHLPFKIPPPGSSPVSSSRSELESSTSDCQGSRRI